MNVDVSSHTDAAQELRARMAAELAGYKNLVTNAILDAVATVPRHLFLPDADLPTAYGLGALVTHRDEQGVALSSAADVTTVSSMLKQLDLHPGQRVLEIGAGTGYNAALLRHLVGPEGSVTTIDILEQAADEAREHLFAAGFADVTVVHGDGERGVPENAPYDRIIVTAGAADLFPAWAEQLAEGGLLVVPLRINGLTRSVVFERRGGHWRGLQMDECGFMPMRGQGQRAEHNISVRGETGVVVRTDGGRAPDAAALSGALEYPATLAWTGVSADYGYFPDLDFWLAEDQGFARVIMMGGGVEEGLVKPKYPWGSMGAHDGATLAYLTTRPASGNALEIGVCGYGPEAAALVERLAARVNAWDREMAGTGDHLWIEVHPAGAEPPPSVMFRAHARYNEIFLGRARAAEEHAG